MFFCYLFTRVFRQCKAIYLCHSDPTNSQLSQLYYTCY